jgi:hypothetical protein
MLRYLATFLYPILLIPLYLDWSHRQSEEQIDKMQRAVFNSPGAEAPVPPTVIVGGVGLLLGYGLLTAIIGTRGWLRAAGLVLGAPVGVAIFMQRQAGRNQ